MDAPRRLFMNKIAKELAEGAGMDERRAKESVKAFFEGVAEALEEGEAVNLRGFGSFRPVRIKERRGRNPQTGAAIVTPAHYSAHFSPSRALADRVNAQYLHLSPRELEEVEHPPPDKAEENAPRPADRRGRPPVWPMIGVMGSLAAGTALYIGTQRSMEPETGDRITAIEKEEAASTAAVTPPRERPDQAPAPTLPPTAPPELLAGKEAPAKLDGGPAAVHTVRARETLWSIAGERWGDPELWRAIYLYNREGLADPDWIYPGQRIEIPSKAEAERLASDYSPLGD